MNIYYKRETEQKKKQRAEACACKQHMFMHSTENSTVKRTKHDL